MIYLIQIKKYIFTRVPFLCGVQFVLMRYVWLAEWNKGKLTPELNENDELW